MEKLTRSALALDSSGVIADPLQYQSRLRFPGALESAYRWDFADRFVVMQRQFIIFGFILYGSFAILDYYAMPRTHMLAWLLRLLVERLRHSAKTPNWCQDATRRRAASRLGIPRLRGPWAHHSRPTAHQQISAHSAGMCGRFREL